jgi:lysozyme
MTAREKLIRERIETWIKRRERAEDKVALWRKRLAALPKPGTLIDVSVHQGTIDYADVKAAGIDGVYIKATEGEDFIDSRFASNVRNARAAGLKVGAYHFLRPRVRAGGAAAEVSDFVTQLKRLDLLAPGNLRPVLDVESTTLSAAATRIYASDAISALRQQTDVKPIFYTFPGFMAAWPDDFKDRADLWIAHYETEKPIIPAPWNRYVAWQWTSKGRVAGVSGDVDKNRVPDMKRLLIQ